MIRFLLKGVLRDRARSLFPFLIVTTGVFLTVALYCYIKGAEINIIRTNANLRHGHVKVMTRAYAAESDQIPNDLALTGAGTLIAELRTAAPDMDWLPRIQFGGLLDIPDANGETRAQAPVAGIAADLRTPGSPEPGLLGLERILVRGRLPHNPGEFLISDDLARKLEVEPGRTATLIGSTMNGSMGLANLTISGTIRFGLRAMDRTGLIADIADIRRALDMEDAAGEILGLTRDGLYHAEQMTGLARTFNARHADVADEYRPVMQTLAEQPGLDWMFARLASVTGIIVSIFLLAMSLVQWNAGLVGTLRRYGEFGLRLAIGENKGHAYRSLIGESVIIGILGSVAGTVLGLALSYYLQVHGIDIARLLPKNINFLMQTVLRSKITPFAYVVGFVPGLFASVIGTAIAGRAVYRRRTAQLFKEFES